MVEDIDDIGIRIYIAKDTDVGADPDIYIKLEIIILSEINKILKRNIYF